MADSVKIRIDGDTTGYKNSLDTLGKMTQSAMKLVTGALVAGASALAGFGVIGLKYNADMESYTTDFEVMLGSQGKALQKVEELKQFAAKTPFEMPQLADATKTLLAFNVANEDTMEKMGMLGDISLGNAQKFESLTRAYGKMNASQKVSLEDINIMIDAGFNPLLLVAEKTGETMTDLYKRISQGGVGVSEIEEAFKKATIEGGQFYQGMEKASQTTKGLISTLKDNTVAKLGEAFEVVSEKLREVLPNVIAFVENLDLRPIVEVAFALIEILVNIMPIIAGLTTAFIGFKTVAIITEVIQGFQTAQLTLQLFTMQAGSASIAQGILNGTLSIGEGIVAVLTGKVTIATLAQKAWNVAMSANPIGVIVGLVVGLIAIIGTLMLTNEDFRKSMQAVFRAILGFFEGIADIALNTIDWLKNNWGKIVEYLNAPFIKFNETLIETGKKIKQWIADKVQEFKDKVEDFKDVGKDIVEGLWEGITSLDDWILEKIQGFAKGIADKFIDFFEIASPSKLMKRLGKFLPQGVGDGIEEGSQDVLKVVDKQADDISKAYAIDVSKVKSVLSRGLAVVRNITDTRGLTKSTGVTNTSSTSVEGDKFYITVKTDNIEELNDMIRIAKEAKRKERMGVSAYA